jgi:L-2-hydroxyglutarate oxidase
MSNAIYDIAIVGGGIIGLSTAFQLQREFPHLKIIIFEKEDQLAKHQTGRNSGVIHSGLYYKPDSFRAKNCVRGRKLLVDFAKQNNINFDICGKLVVAKNEIEVKELERLRLNGERNGLKGLAILSEKEAQKIEPYIRASKALLVPEAGIIDYKEVVKKLAHNIESINPNSRILRSCKVLNYQNMNIQTTLGDFSAKHIVFCGGLFSDRLAKKDNLKTNMQIVGFRGDYYKLSERARHKVNNLVYPVPNPEFPFLGVHFTRMIDGNIECGPNAVFTFKREGYSKYSFSFKDTLEALSYKGTRRLFINHWKFGLNEYKRAFSKSLFLKQLREIMPNLSKEDIVSGKTGVRAMALSIEGDIIDDFKIMRNRNNIHVLNAPSPAATACLAIGEHIMKQTCINFNL